MEFRADLHCHSFFSDGTDSPKELINLAIQKELSGLSITDHDTIDAYKELFQLPLPDNFFVLPGLEFSTFFRGEAIHLLCYAFSLKSEAIHAFCQRHKKRREYRNRLILEKLKKLGIHIDEEELKDPRLPNRTIGRPQIANRLVEKNVVESIRAAFDKYLADGKPAYAVGEPFSVEETLKVIKEGKGKAILAHPHLIKKSTTAREILKMPLDGIEAYYARLNSDQEAKWVHEGQKRGWIITGGSDYHGLSKPQNILGSSWVGKETFQILYEHYQNVASTS